MIKLRVLLLTEMSDAEFKRLEKKWYGYDANRRGSELLTKSDAIEVAQYISKKEGVVQHVNQLRPSASGKSFVVADWYDADETVISFENGREL